MNDLTLIIVTPLILVIFVVLGFYFNDVRDYAKFWWAREHEIRHRCRRRR